MKSKLVSIIIPTYNSSKFISETIHSILNQTYQNFEIIVIDDCSTDNTLSILKKIKNQSNKTIKIFKTHKNFGTGAGTRNLGIRSAKGDLICFNDSDDLWEKEKLQEQLINYKDKKCIYFSSARYFVNKKKKSSFFINFLRKLVQMFVVKKINNNGFYWFYLYNPVLTSSVLIHKNAFKNNFFDQHINAREDIDMWIRLRKENYRLFLNSKILVNIRRRKNSSSSNPRKELITMIRSLSNIFFKIKNFSYLNYFLTGIIFKFLLFFIKLNLKKILNLFKKSFVIFAFLYFLIYYSPLFWHIGKPLLHHDDVIQLQTYKNIVIYNGHGTSSNFNMTYQQRYSDVVSILQEIESLENIYIIGSLQEIPEQRIIEKLLVSDGVAKEKIKVIYEQYDTTSKNIVNVKRYIKNDNVNEIIFVTSPYHSKRARLLWSQHHDLNVKFWKANEWPPNNGFFKRALNKKMIISEYISIIYSKLFSN